MCWQLWSWAKMEENSSQSTQKHFQKPKKTLA